MDDANKVSIAAFARSHNKSKQAAAKWKVRGYLVMDGAFVLVAESDAKLKGARLGRFADGADESAPAKAAPVRAVTTGGRQRVEREATSGDGLGDQPELDLKDFSENVLAGRFSTRAQAEQVKENGLALKHLLDGHKKAGELIETTVAEAIFFEEFRGVRDSWLNWPTRVAPFVAADLGVETEKVVEVLTAHVYKHLSDLGEPDPEFREPGTSPANVSAGPDTSTKDQHS
jgi:hypothetical protein